MSDPMKPGVFDRAGPARRLGSSLARFAARAPTSAAEMLSLRCRAWRESGVAVLRPEEIADAFARQALVNAAEALFGPRGAQNRKPPGQPLGETESNGKERP